MAKTRIRSSRRSSARQGRSATGARSRSRSRRVGDPWSEFAQKYSDHPSVNEEAIYSLPPRLLDAIRHELPTFLSDDEVEYERDLARIAGSGFFMRHRFVHPLLGPEPERTNDEVEFLRRNSQQLEQIRAMQADEMRRDGWSRAEIAERFDIAAAIDAKVRDQQLAYLGWLVTDPLFRASRDHFRRQWKARVRRNRELPRIPTSFLGKAPRIPLRSRDFYIAYSQFYLKWSLEALTTWELPEPLRHGLAGQTDYHLPTVGQAGIALFVPWYLLRDGKIKLDDLVPYHMMAFTPRHLHDWLAKDPLGPIRYRAMLYLYVYLELALKQRYPQKLRGATPALDRAFERFIYGHPVSENAAAGAGESIRKIRLAMHRRLKQELAAN